MVQVDARQVTSGFISLFDPAGPASIRCFSVLAGANAGKIMTDDLHRPTWGIVWEADDGTMYLGGAPNSQVVNDAIAELGREGNVLFGFRDERPLVGIDLPDPDAAARVLEYDRPLDTGDLDPYLGRLPAGYEVHRMDRALLLASAHHDATVQRYGSLEAFLEQGVAVCLLRGREILCEAYADGSVNGVREIGVRTGERYRGQGLATITCAHLIKACAEAGDRVYWNCAKSNAASAAVARKLGFQNQREYQLIAWFKATT
jgi:RimJ/RimL family protein N-acetyltransferase